MVMEVSEGKLEGMLERCMNTGRKAYEAKIDVEDDAHGRRAMR